MDFRRSRRAGPETRPVARAVGSFAVAGLVGVVVLAGGSLFVSRGAATDTAVRDASRDAQLAARAAIQPALSDGLLTADPAAIGRVDQVVRGRLLDGALVRVKIWGADGTIYYSDEPRLIGSIYPLQADERHALATGIVAADVSDLSRPENRFDRSFRKLLEVYLPMRTPNRTAVLFEVYYRYDSVLAGAWRLWREMAPVMLGSLLVLEALQIPLAWSMARRLRNGVRRQERLLRRAIEASDAERRRIASDLHDGVVQDLAGVTFALASVQGQDEASRQTLERAAATTRRSIRALRSLLVEIYPPNLRSAGLRAALTDLSATLGARGVEARLDLEGAEGLPEPVEALLFRTAQEALRNVVSHAGAHTVSIALGRPAHRVVLEVSDDGAGFDTAVLQDRPGEGHVGLRVLADLAGDAGGSLEVDSAPGRGTRVRIELPAEVAA